MTKKVEPIAVEELYRRCDPDRFDFETTADLEDATEVVVQDRASEALRFGIGIGGRGFNVYALGPEETDKQTLVRHFIEKRAVEEEPPPDICYVNNFGESRRPRALRLPPGTGRRWSADMDKFLEELQPALNAAFESEEYQTRRQAVEEEVGEEQQEAFERLQEEARERDLALLRTPAGFVFAPVREGDVLSPDQIGELPEEEQERLESTIEELQEKLQDLLRKVPRKQREVRDRVRDLNREIARYTVKDLLRGLRSEYADHPTILEHLDAVEEDIVHNVGSLVGGQRQIQELLQGGDGLGGGGPRTAERSELRRYRVNVLVDHSDSEHAPVVYEDNPTHENLLGRIEHLAQRGALVTDFNLIRPGALHRANGGYLLVDVRRVLLQPFAWEGLKRVLQAGELRIESPQEMLGLLRTVSLEPEPVPLELKVILIGNRLLYYLLAEFDPDFGDLFKVQADFDDQLHRTEENELLYARLVASLVEKEGLRPFDRSAVARVIERSSRMAGDAERLSVRTRGVLDLIRESDFWAGEDGEGVVTVDHVRRAVEKKIHRSDRARERLQEEILRDTLYIDTEGEREGQVNGLSVLRLGDFSFGRPTRITARAGLGKGEVVDIEREVELGGPIHSKGVLILSGFLRARYASDRPLSLSASLVFEQSYGEVEGDSASCAELCALLSSVADLPVKQSLAVTGSINQHGDVQPIGGVNEKVEGFFDICRGRELNGEQGVLVPAANVKHLMLREDVREAVAEDRFRIYPIEHVDEALELLTGRPVGERDEEGRYPEGSLNRRVEERLAELAERRQEFAGEEEKEEG